MGGAAGSGDFAREGVREGEGGHPALDRIRIPSGTHCVFRMTHVNHLDLTWYWRLRDSVEMALETVRWHVELLKKHPDAVYSHTQVLILRIAERLDPPLFKRVRSL